jgi:hypothetical protein
MARTTITSQKKNMTIPGMAYPATDLALVATAPSYPGLPDLFRYGGHGDAMPEADTAPAGE